jgi:ligand-binding SRPBCC domain-containing protein
MTHHFQTEQWVPFPLESVFLFFANPQNLPRITPPALDMRIEALKLVAPQRTPSASGSSDASSSLAGVESVIVTSFRLVPFLPVRAAWTSLIVEFAWNHYFVDIQDKGPFKSFRHKHELVTRDQDGISGTVVRDSVDYDVGFGPIGSIARSLFVSRQLKSMFSHRQRVLNDLLRSAHRF